MPLPEPPDELQSLELLRRLRSGDATAFEVLYRRHHDELLLAVRTGMGPRLREAMQSEDVLQSVAAEAFALLRHEAPVAGFTGLLRRLVRHRLIDRARAVARQRRVGLLATTDGSASEPVAATPPSYHDPRYLRLELALARLPPDLRDVLRLRRFDGLSSQEVAARTGRTDDAVRKSFSRAMARLTLLVREGP